MKSDILRKATAKVMTTRIGQLAYDKGPRAMVIGGVVVLIGTGIHAIVKTPAFYESMKDEPDGFVRAKAAIRTYAPDAIVAALAAAAIIGGDGIVNERVIQWMAAYKALDISYEELLGRFEEHLGKERFEEILYDVEEVDNEDGEKEKVYSQEACEKVLPYSRFFDEANPNWDNRNPMYNRNFLQLQHAYANQLLDARSSTCNAKATPVFLNEILEMNGDEWVDEGWNMGWCKDEEHPDEYISFGLDDMSDPAIRRFMLGDEPSVLLRYNCRWVRGALPRDVEFAGKRSWKDRLDGLVSID